MDSKDKHRGPIFSAPLKALTFLIPFTLSLRVRLRLRAWTHILRFNLNLKFTFSPPFNIGFKGKVKLKSNGEYGSCSHGNDKARQVAI